MQYKIYHKTQIYSQISTTFLYKNLGNSLYIRSKVSKQRYMHTIISTYLFQKIILLYLYIGNLFFHVLQYDISNLSYKENVECKDAIVEA